MFNPLQIFWWSNFMRIQNFYLPFLFHPDSILSLSPSLSLIKQVWYQEREREINTKKSSWSNPESSKSSSWVSRIHLMTTSDNFFSLFSCYFFHSSGIFLSHQVTIDVWRLKMSHLIVLKNYNCGHLNQLRMEKYSWKEERNSRFMHLFLQFWMEVWRKWKSQLHSRNHSIKA